jgi:hypothetical protein
MKWIYISFVCLLVYSLNSDEGADVQPMLWVLGAVIVLSWILKLKGARSRTEAASLTITTAGGPAARSLESRRDLEMFSGLQDWKDGDGTVEVARALSAFWGRDVAYVRSLLAAAYLRDDPPGQVVVSATRLMLHKIGAVESSEQAL